jgi:uncharacterized protein (DUF302 family)
VPLRQHPKTLEAESNIGLVLPCSVVVQESSGGGVDVSIADPKAMFTLVDESDVAPVAEDAGKGLGGRNSSQRKDRIV